MLEMYKRKSESTSEQICPLAMVTALSLPWTKEDRKMKTLISVTWTAPSSWCQWLTAYLCWAFRQQKFSWERESRFGIWCVGSQFVYDLVSKEVKKRLAFSLNLNYKEEVTDAHVIQNSSMQHSPFSEARISSARPEIPRILWNPEGSWPRSQEPAACPYP